MPQGMLPFFPAGVTEISSALAFMQEEGRITYFNYQMPVFIHEAKDVATFHGIISRSPFAEANFVKLWMTVSRILTLRIIMRWLLTKSNISV